MREAAGSPDGTRAAGGEPGASRRKSERRGATGPFALLRRADGKRAGQTRDSTEKAQRLPEGPGFLGADELGWNSASSARIRALPYRPPTALPPRARSLCSRRERCRGWDEAGRVSGAHDPGAPRPGVAGRASGLPQSVRPAAAGPPARAAPCPRRTQVSRATLGREAAQPAGKVTDGRSGRDTLGGEPGSLFSLQMKASDRRPRPSLGNLSRGTWYRIYPHSFLPGHLHSGSRGRNHYANIWGWPARSPARS